MICVVEDDPNIREIEVYAMKDCHMETKEASCAKEFWKLCENEVPELVLLDIMLPDEDGISIVKKMREDARLSDVPVILVTAKGTEIDKVRGLDAGADDYIAKPFGILEMISRVKAVLRRSKSQEASVEELSAGNIRMNVEKHRVYVDDELIELTYKEFELLRVFLSNAGNVMPRNLLMDRVWGTTFEGESRTRNWERRENGYIPLGMWGIVWSRFFFSNILHKKSLHLMGAFARRTRRGIDMHKTHCLIPACSYP